MADDHLLWSAVMRGDGLVAIGYKPADEGDIKERMHLIDISEEAWQAARQKIINFVVEEMNRDFPNEKFTAASLMPLTENGTLPFINMRITSERVLTALRHMPEVRYVEPSGYSFASEDEEQITYRSDASLVGATYRCTSASLVGAMQVAIAAAKKARREPRWADRD